MQISRLVVVDNLLMSRWPLAMSEMQGKVLKWACVCIMVRLG